MSLKDRIAEDIKFAQKSGDAERVSVLRLLSAAIHNREIEKFGSGDKSPLSDAEIIQVIQKECKKRKEAAELFVKGGRKDMADKEEREFGILSAYLPPAASREEMERAVAEVIEEGIKDMGGVMQGARAKLAGKQVEGKELSEIVKRKLGL
jgi:uncharacterized protein YqeY